MAVFDFAAVIAIICWLLFTIIDNTEAPAPIGRWLKIIISIVAIVVIVLKAGWLQ